MYTLYLQLESLNKPVIILYSYYLQLRLKQINSLYTFKSISFITNNKKLHSFLKSPHVNKKAQEQFVLTQYKKVFIISSTSHKIFQLIPQLLVNLPSLIKIKIKSS